MLDPQERVEAQAQEVALSYIKVPETSEQMFLVGCWGDWSRLESIDLFRDIVKEYARGHLRMCLALTYRSVLVRTAVSLTGVPEQM